MLWSLDFSDVTVSLSFQSQKWTLTKLSEAMETDFCQFRKPSGNFGLVCLLGEMFCLIQLEQIRGRHRKHQRNYAFQVT